MSCSRAAALLFAWLLPACSLDRSGHGLDVFDARTEDRSAPDLGPPDLGPRPAPDLGAPESGLDATALDVADLGRPDSGTTDSGPDARDSGPADLGPPDLGAPDLGPADSGPDVRDLGPLDACTPSPARTSWSAEDRAGLSTGTAAYVEIVEPGQIELSRDPHRYGALLGVGFDRALVDARYDLDIVETGLPTGAVLVGAMDQSYGGGAAPPWLGLPGDGYTLYLRGEIFLSTGTWTFELTADENGVLEVGADAALRLTHDRRDPAPTGTLTLDADGWYPIRLAYSDISGASGFRVRYGATAALSVVPASALRFDASSVPARELHGWNDRVPSGLPDAERLDDEPSQVDWGPSFPPRIGIDNGNDWALRWVGRLYFPTPDAMLALSSDDSHRVWLDGVCFDGSYDTFPATTMLGPRLAPGWHDVVLELTEGSGGAYLRAHRDSSAFSTTDMHPGTRFGGHVATRMVRGPLSLTVVTPAHADLTLDEPRPDLVAVEVSVLLDATVSLADTMVEVTAPSGRRRSWAAAPQAVSVGINRWALRVVWTGDGLPPSAAGDWDVEVRGGTGLVTTVGIVAHSGGLAAPYATVGTWESAPIDLGSATELTDVGGMFDARYGTSVRYEARAGATTAELRAAPWVAPSASPAGLPAGVIGRFAQARVVLSGDGTDTPRVRSVRLAGRSCTP